MSLDSNRDHAATNILAHEAAVQSQITGQPLPKVIKTLLENISIISDDGHGCDFRPARNAFRGGSNEQITVGVEEDPIFLRGLFLILEGENETEEWYLVSVGHDENGGFSVEPSTDDNKWSRAIWSIFWGLIGIFIFHSSFLKENR